ncbi:MAG: hypothetical protein E6929_04840 [Clostridium sp.]|nr:hypothetical protein [Clostridium sp.]
MFKNKMIKFVSASCVALTLLTCLGGLLQSTSSMSNKGLNVSFNSMDMEDPPVWDGSW